MADLRTKLQALRSEINSCVFERETQVDGALAAILSGQHLLFLGPPGTAKSLLTNILCQAIDDSKYFSWLLTKFSTPEELFGPYSLAGLKEDHYRRVTSGKLPECHIAFLDEIFKANSAILNSLLTVVNERKFHNNGGATNIPLVSCFGASNELPKGEELGALYDRFVLRYWVDYMTSDDNFVAMLDGTPDSVTTKLTLDELRQMQQEVEKVTVSQDILRALFAVKQDMKAEKIVPSDRRWKVALKVLKAFAYLNGKDAVTQDEFEYLADMMWDKPEHRSVLCTVLAKYSNPFTVKAVEYEDEAYEIYTNWTKLDKNSSSYKLDTLTANDTMKEILRSVADDIRGRNKREVKKLIDVEKKISSWKQEMVKVVDI